PGLDAGRRGARARRRGQSARSQARVAARDQTGAQRGGEEGKQVMRRAVALVAIWLSITGAATPRPLEPPPPDLARVIPFAAAPSEKPHLTIELPIPPAPVELPAFPPTSPMAPVADKPTAFISSPRALPCVGSWLGIASESLECGRARFQRGDFEDAAKALDNAVRKGTERELVREARYWQAETLWRLDRIEQADWLFRQVAQEAPGQDLGIWALHGSGWTALRLRETVRARDAFTTLLAGSTPSPLDVWGRHGLALSLYALGQWADADKEWSQLESRGVPPTLAREVLFWHGDTLGRVGEPARAEIMLQQFTRGGAHPWHPAARRVGGRGRASAGGRHCLPRILRQRGDGVGDRGSRPGAAGHGRLGRRAQERCGARRAALAARISDAVSSRARVRGRPASRRRRARLPGAARRPARPLRARLGADGQGRGPPRAGRARRRPHAVRAGAEDGARHAGGAPGGAAAKPRRLRAARVHPGRRRRRPGHQRTAGAGRPVARAPATGRGRLP